MMEQRSHQSLTITWEETQELKPERDTDQMPATLSV